VIAKRGWTAEQDALLGTDTDAAIGARVGKTWQAVASRRAKLRVPAHRAAVWGQQSERWRDEEIASLGVLADYQIAERSGRPLVAVSALRRALGRASVDRLVRAVLRADRREMPELLSMLYGMDGIVPSVATLTAACGIQRATAYRYIARLRRIAALVEDPDRANTDKLVTDDVPPAEA
jgi:hypothetical protein